MVNYGYIIVDATGWNIAEVGSQSVSGIYVKLQGALATGKPVLLGGLVSGDAELSPMPAVLNEAAGISVVGTNGYAVLVTDDDEISAPVA